MCPHQVGATCGVVQARNKSMDVWVFVLKVEEFLLVEPFLVECHLAVIVL
jgi:hypothetical protein